MMYSLVPEYDSAKTRKKAKEVLKKYRSLARKASRESVPLQATSYTHMPFYRSNRNKREDALVTLIDAKNERDEIERALLVLPLISQQVLWYSYCERNRHTHFQIAKRMGYTDKSVERFKSIALIEFAEAYKGGSLLVYKERKN